MSIDRTYPWRVGQHKKGRGKVLRYIPYTQFRRAHAVESREQPPTQSIYSGLVSTWRRPVLSSSSSGVEDAAQVAESDSTNDRQPSRFE